MVQKLHQAWLAALPQLMATRPGGMPFAPPPFPPPPGMNPMAPPFQPQAPSAPSFVQPPYPQVRATVADTATPNVVAAYYALLYLCHSATSATERMFGLLTLPNRLDPAMQRRMPMPSHTARHNVAAWRPTRFPDLSARCRPTWTSSGSQQVRAGRQHGCVLWSAPVHALTGGKKVTCR